MLTYKGPLHRGYKGVTGKVGFMPPAVVTQVRTIHALEDISTIGHLQYYSIDMHDEHTGQESKIGLHGLNF